jgi:hypothetical protein
MVCNGYFVSPLLPLILSLSLSHTHTLPHFLSSSPPLSPSFSPSLPLILSSLAFTCSLAFSLSLSPSHLRTAVLVPERGGYLSLNIEVQMKQKHLPEGGEGRRGAEEGGERRMIVCVWCECACLRV